MTTKNERKNWKQREREREREGTEGEERRLEIINE